MSAIALRPAPTTRFRRSRSHASVETLNERITLLQAERQTLRAAGAGSAALERNRLQIARSQWELAHALIERHAPRADARQSAAA